jgi:hypothetical protein
MTEPITLTANDLTTGDKLLRLGGVGYAQLRDPDSPPVIVSDVRPPLDDHDPDEAIIEIITSAGVMYARQNAPALAIREDAVTAHTILLISRRQMLHARLTEFGVPVIRRTPLTDSRRIPAVTPTEWLTAPLIVIDGYLSRTTIQNMWNRGDLHDRDQIIMVGTDPDDVRVYGRQQAANARMLALLPYDKANLSALFNAAVHTETDTDPYLGILTPKAMQ